MKKFIERGRTTTMTQVTPTRTTMSGDGGGRLASVNRVNNVYRLIERVKREK